MSRAVLVLGGAGFVGSHVTERFVRAGYQVTVVDGFLPGTGAREASLAPVLGQIELVRARVEDAADLGALVARSEIVVDALAFTSHHVALKEPARDLELNAASHLPVIRALGQAPKGKKVVYLASRGQYGRPKTARILEDTPMVPEDVQGIHKLAGESYYRVYSAIHGFSATSLRFPNCFGPNQQTGAGDIGLIGSFIRDLSAGKTVEVYGARRRQLVYAPDVAEVVLRLAEGDAAPSFTAYNHAGPSIPIEELVRRLAAIIGRGAYVTKELPPEVARMDIGEAQLVEDLLRARLGAIPETDLDTALAATVHYFTK